MLIALCWLMLLAFGAAPHLGAPPTHHYVFFGRDRDVIRSDTLFLGTPAFEGAQVAYTWRQLEPRKDAYDFSAIHEDLAFLASRQKKLWIQLQDVSFSETVINVPRYLLDEPQYNGGAARQYRARGDDDANAVVEGWTPRRWDPAVQDRLYRLLDTLGQEFDGRIEGINFAETSLGFGNSGRLHPAGFTPEIYRDAVIANIQALKRAFPRSVAMVYANFMPGEWRPTEDRGYLRAVYDAAKRSGVGVGGPDLFPFRPGQLGSSYPLIHDAAGVVPTGIAVQDGNFEERNPKTRARVTIRDLVDFATQYLKVDYIFWGRQEPYYSGQAVPFVRGTQGERR